MTSLIRIPIVLNRTGLSKSKMYELINRGEFPRPIKLSERSVAWSSDEINSWIKEKLSKSISMNTTFNGGKDV